MGGKWVRLSFVQIIELSFTYKLCDREKKIVLKGNSTEHLMELYDKAKEANIPAYLVRDAGHTQIPRGSVTVLSLFGTDENVDKITGKLSLL